DDRQVVGDRDVVVVVVVLAEGEVGRGVAHRARAVRGAGTGDRGRVVRQPDHGDVRAGRLERRTLRLDDRGLEEGGDTAVEDRHGVSPWASSAAPCRTASTMFW